MNVVKVEYGDLPQTTSMEFTYCRKLLKDGFDPSTKVEFCRNGRVDLIIDNIGKGAKLSVREHPRLEFIKHRPFK